MGTLNREMLDHLPYALDKKGLDEVVRKENEHSILAVLFLSSCTSSLAIKRQQQRLADFLQVHHQNIHVMQVDIASDRELLLEMRRHAGERSAPPQLICYRNGAFIKVLDFSTWEEELEHGKTLSQMING